jgi:crossover junction endodeoxyribonuclease RusA
VNAAAIADRFLAASGVYHVTLPYPVSANRYWVMAKRGTKTYMLVSDEANAFKAEVYARCLEAGIRRPIVGRVELRVELYPELPKDWEKRAAKSKHWSDSVRCMDLSNALKVTEDALKGVAFGDDSWVRSITMVRMEPDAHGARVVVTVRAMS